MEIAGSNEIDEQKYQEWAADKEAKRTERIQKRLAALGTHEAVHAPYNPQNFITNGLEHSHQGQLMSAASRTESADQFLASLDNLLDIK